MNHHATAIILGDSGLLIRGRSGVGKTTLALALVEMSRAGGRFARLVSDDQVLLEAHGGRLVCRPPDAIAGLAEYRGVGPRRTAFEPGMVVDLVADLVEHGSAPRYPERDSVTLEGCEIPFLAFPEHEIAGPALVILRKLEGK
jgi:serine kinase of HPr protein (carbohydrate metabolism regulator)